MYRKYLVTINCIIMAGAGLLLTPWYAVWAEDLGSIRGIVRRQGQGVADHRIMLIRFGPGQEVNRTPGQTDADGRFLFEGLETGPDLTYVVGIRYAEQLYRSASVELEPGQSREGVMVEVEAQGAAAAETDTATAPVHISHHMMAVVLRDNHLEVREIVSIRHSGSTPYQGTTGQAGQGAYVLHLPLPEGYVNLRDVQGWNTEHVRSDAFGLYYTAPLPPGTHRVIYSYTLPMPDNLAMVLARRTLSTIILDVFVEATQLVAASDLPFRGRVPLESHTFFHFRGTELAAHSRVWLQLTRMTTSATPVLKIGGYVVIIGMAMLGMLIPLYDTWRGCVRPMREKTVTPEDLWQLHADRTRLLQTIARLDHEHEAGTLDERAYWHQRQAYKQQLLTLVEHLHDAQHDQGKRLLATQKGLG